MRLPTSPKAPSPAERSAVVSAPSHRLTPSPHRPFRPAYCLLLGLALIPLNAFWLVRMEVAGMYGGAGGTTGPYPTSFSLYANAVVWLLLLVSANRLLLRRVPRLALSQAELLVVYVMLVVASSIHSLDLMDVLVPMLGHPTWFATPENGWARTILPHIPPAWRVQSQEALIGYYQGNSSLYRWAALRRTRYLPSNWCRRR